MQKKIIRRVDNVGSLTEHALHPLLQRIYSNRGIQSEKEIERGLNFLLPYHSLANIDSAVKLLAEALKLKQTILIVGDFDADGATSTALAIRALKSFGATSVHYLVPNRFSFGYGLTPELVQVAKEVSPDLIVTVDNGIANHAGVAEAQRLGMKVLITDHHLPAETLPTAEVIVNPNQPNDVFPSKNLAGVGVIFYVMLALRRFLADNNWFKENNLNEPNMAHLLDLVALGTVADVVPLDHNNRILIHQGLGRIRQGSAVPGINALLEVSGREFHRIKAADLGFAVAPRLNAAGRLDDMSLGIECLLCDDINQAREQAELLNQLNEERRVIERDMQEQAFHILKKLHTDDETPSALCLFDESWHQGVIGILAGRMKDRFHRPCIVFAEGSETELKGSARSISGVHIRDILAEIAAKHPSLIKKFGGHSMAAGLTIEKMLFKDFASIFKEVVTAKLADIELQHILLSDGELTEQELNLSTAEMLYDAGPWGQAFPEPLFDGVFEVLDQRLVGGRHLKMTLNYQNKQIEAIAFNIDINQWPNYRCQQVSIAYRLDINQFRQKRSLQLIVEQLESV